MNNPESPKPEPIPENQETNEGSIQPANDERPINFDSLSEMPKFAPPKPQSISKLLELGYDNESANEIIESHSLRTLLDDTLSDKIKDILFII